MKLNLLLSITFNMVLTDAQRELIERTMLQLLKEKGWFTAHNVYAELEGRLEGTSVHTVAGFVMYHGQREFRREHDIEISSRRRIDEKTGQVLGSINIYHCKDVFLPEHIEY